MCACMYTCSNLHVVGVCTWSYVAKDAVKVAEVDLTKIQKVVFVDSQWQKCSRMLEDVRLKKLQCIKLTKHNTNFWRYPFAISLKPASFFILNIH